MRRRCVGIWIDHEQALLVRLDGSGSSDLSRISSHAEGRRKSRGGAGGSQAGGANHSAHEERRHQTLRRYYRQVIDALREVDQVLILGPGLAKRELENEIERDSSVRFEIAGIETADKMTENQLIAKVKSSFGS